MVLGVAAFVVARIVERERRPRVSLPVTPIELPPTVKTIEPIVIPTPTESPVTPRTDTPRSKPQTQPPVTPRTPDTNTGGAPPAFQPLPFPSFALPSSLPPLPSTFPALPTALPYDMAELIFAVVPAKPVLENAGIF